VPEQSDVTDEEVVPGGSGSTGRTAGRDHRLVVGMDGSPQSLAALDWVANLAEATGASVEVLASWEWPTNFGATLVVSSDYDPHADAEALVGGAVRDARARHPSVSFVPLVARGRPATMLVEASAGADLLAVGSRGHGEVSGALIGSVAEHCAAHAHCPVLVIRGGR
jgi:nucleotide-binding universal stress UspA family protein